MIGLMRFNVRSKCGMRSSECGVLIPQSLPAAGRRIRNPESKGMTLVEVITVLAILAILAAVVIPKLGLPTTTSTASVDGAAYMIASDIRYAQEFAMANRVSKSVNFTSGLSIYTFSPTSGLDPSGQLPSGVQISGSNYTITFNSLGEPTTGGGGSVTVTGGGQSSTISVVNYTGKVNIT
jgi:prepilin-type N-terminal cleavage/methylation domain-containing protein